MYRVNEIFYSLQGEGIRAGTANVFVRFSGCNLKCSVGDEFSGFDCDTEFVSGINYTEDELIDAILATASDCPNVILTGGEPSLQIDQPLINRLKNAGLYVAIETNGTKQLPQNIDWICVSPKSAEHTLRATHADELKYVRFAGQGIPRPSITSATHKLLSPAFNADWSIDRAALDTCIKLVKEHPSWRLSMQQHKIWRVR